MPTKTHKIVGTVRFQATGSGGVRWLDNFEADNITTVFIPELKGVPTYGGRFSGNVRFYKRAAAQLKAAFAEIGRRGLAGDIIFWDGSYVPRMQRGSSTAISEHSFGCAFDVNADWNPFRRSAAAPGTKGSLWRVAPIIKKYGFDWGNDWRNSKDGMHFEVNRILTAAEIATLSGGAISPSAPAKAPGLILMVAREGQSKPDYERIASARLENGTFVADIAEIVTSVLDATGRGEVREVLKFYGFPHAIPPGGNHLDDPDDPRVYLVVDARRAAADAVTAAEEAAR